MATLTTTEILTDTLDAFKLQFPMLGNFTSDMSSGSAVKGQTIMAHIANLPTASTYDATTGYALGKSIVDFALGKVLAANFTNAVNESVVGDVDRETLGAIRKEMNLNGAAPSGRFGIVNGDAFESLDTDPRIASADYHGQQIEGNSLGQLNNVSGFEAIYEYPTLAANGELLAGVFLDPRGIAIATRLPDHNIDYANDLGIPRAGKFEVVEDPDSGLALLGISWEQPGTFDQFLTVTVLHGAAAGAQGGSAGAITDKAGVRLTTTS